MSETNQEFMRNKEILDKALVVELDINEFGEISVLESKN